MAAVDRPAVGRPTVVGGTQLGRPITVTGDLMHTGGPKVVGGWQPVDGPVTVPGDVTTVEPTAPGRPIAQGPVSVPVDGGTRPVWEGEGPPPDFIPGARVGDYYLDKVSGLLYRLGGTA